VHTRLGSFLPLFLSLCPLTSHWYLPLEKTYFFPPALHFFSFFLKCLLVVQGVLPGTSGLCISCFNQTVPPHYSLIPYHHAPQ
jgi:hypothetical protein